LPCNVGPKPAHRFGRHGSQSMEGADPMSSGTEIRPFRVDFPEEEVADLRRRIAATRWPERETVTDDSQGVRLAMMQELARYWGADYDWRSARRN
jgi:hypothetical protein